jgi:hypothetical protein
MGIRTTRSNADAFANTMYDGLWLTLRASVVFRVQVAMSWPLQKPAMTAPVDVPMPSHLVDAIAELDVAFTTAEIERLETNYIPRQVTGFSVLSSTGRQ